MHSCRARRACHPDEPISKCLLRKRRVLYTEPRLSSFDAGPEPVLHLIGGQPTFQPSRASGPSPAHPRLRHVRAAARFEQNRAAFAHDLRAAACGSNATAWRAGRSTKARSEEHTSELQSLMRISYAVFCLKKKKTNKPQTGSRTKPKTTT